jgi:hypothetical protein
LEPVSNAGNKTIGVKQALNEKGSAAGRAFLVYGVIPIYHSKLSPIFNQPFEAAFLAAKK